jgi:hypothetical protein
MGQIKSKIFTDSGLLLQEYSGDLTKDDMSAYFTGLYQNPEYLRVSMIFSDFTNANAILTIREISEIAYYILKHAPVVQHVNNAILVSKPIVTAYSMVYNTIMRAMPFYSSGIFSTFKEAANYITFDADKLGLLMKTSFPE